MEINIHKCLIQILDSSTDTFVDSLELIELNDIEEEVLINKTRRAFLLPKRKCGLKGEEKHNNLLLNYKDNKLKEFANKFGKDYFKLKTENSAFNNTYLIYVDVRINENDYLLVIDNALKTCISHNTEFKDDILNRLVEYKTVLPKDIGSSDRFILFDYLNKDLQIYESNDGKNLFEKMFELDSIPTANEAFKVFESKVIEVSQNNDIPLSDSLPEFKNTFLEAKVIDPELIAKEVFNDNLIAQNEFKMKMANEGFKEDYLIKQSELALPKRSRTMKYVTESGIEIIVPANIIKRKDKVEITTNPDGTTSIEIKNISKLKNKL